MKMSYVKRTLTAILSAVLVVSAQTAAFADDTAETPAYETKYYQNFDEFDPAHMYVYAYAGGGGQRGLDTENMYSGRSSVKFSIDGSNGSYGMLQFQTKGENDWTSADYTFESGKTYIMSFKAKKAKNSAIGILAVRDTKDVDDYSHGFGAFSEDWKTYSYKFTADDTNGYENRAPMLLFSGDKGSSIYLDDLKFVEVNDTSLLSTPIDTSSVTAMDKLITVKYNFDMSADAADVRSYTIDGTAPASVTKIDDKTFDIVPANAITSETAELSISASDSMGRAVNKTAEISVIDSNYEVKYFQNYDEFNEAHTYVYAYAAGGGKRGLDKDVKYSGRSSIKFTIDGTNGNFGMLYLQNRDKDIEWQPADYTFDAGKTYVMSFKIKKSAGADIKISAVRDQMKKDEFLYDNGVLSENWVTFSYKFTANESNGYTKGGPWLIFSGSENASAYIDDLKFVQINNDNIAGFTANYTISDTKDSVTVTYGYSAEEAEAVKPENYVFNGVAAKEVAKISDKIYTVTPAEKFADDTIYRFSIYVPDKLGRLARVNAFYVNLPANAFAAKGLTAPEKSNNAGYQAAIGEIYNTTDKTKTALAMVAVYNGSELVKVQCKEITVLPNTHEVITGKTVSAEITPDDSCSVKALVWDKDSFVPLCEAK